MFVFRAAIKIIGINPYVSVPERILKAIFAKAGKDKGSIPVQGTVNGKKFKQTLVKYSGEWRLYINTNMLKDSPRRNGERIELCVDYDPEPRIIEMHPLLAKALKKKPAAKKVFDALAPSHRKEIVRYIASLKSEASVTRNVERAIGYLAGKNRFVGRDNPGLNRA